MFVFALSGEIRTNEILLSYPMRYDYLINITHKTYFVHISDTLANITFSCAFSTVYIAQNVGPLCEHWHENAFSIH